MSGISIQAAGSARRGRRGSRIRRRSQKAMTLQLTSLMDVLMIMVVFLLKSYGISSMNISQTDKLHLPVSRAPETFGEGLALIVAQDRILVDSDEVLRFENNGDDKKFILPEGSVNANDSRGILPLYDALKKKKDDFELLASRAPDPEAALKQWKGEVMIQADKEVPYELLRRVMYTAGALGYQVFRLTVEKQPE